MEERLCRLFPVLKSDLENQTILFWLRLGLLRYVVAVLVLLVVHGIVDLPDVLDYVMGKLIAGTFAAASASLGYRLGIQDGMDALLREEIPSDIEKRGGLVLKIVELLQAAENCRIRGNISEERYYTRRAAMVLEKFKKTLSPDIIPQGYRASDVRYRIDPHMSEFLSEEEDDDMSPETRKLSPAAIFLDESSKT